MPRIILIQEYENCKISKILYLSTNLMLQLYDLCEYGPWNRGVSYLHWVVARTDVVDKLIGGMVEWIWQLD